MENVDAEPWKQCQSKAQGRYLVTTGPVRAGQQLMQETPLVMGPTALSSPVCLSCHHPVTTLIRCSTCQWPMCSPACAEDIRHRAECAVLAQDVKGVGVPSSSEETPRYDLILILRCLLLKNEPEKWNTLMSLESHWERHKKGEEPHHVAAVKYFTLICPTGLNADVVHRVRAIVMTNCISTKFSHCVHFRGIYPRVSMINHSCLPSVVLRSDRNHKLFINAAVDLEEDEHITFNYVSTGDPYWKRQRDLEEGYHFRCSCPRCTDRTEMKTHFSTIKCTRCKKGFLDPMFNKKKTYRCSSCRFAMPQMKVMHLCIAMHSLYGKADNAKDVQAAIGILKEIFDRGHAKHYTWLQCAQILLKNGDRLKTIDGLRLRKQLWMRFLDMHAVIEPGWTRRRGISLLQLISVTLAILSVEASTLPEDLVRREIDCTKARLEEAKLIMNTEPEDTTEQRWVHCVGKEARRLEELEDMLDERRDNLSDNRNDESCNDEPRNEELPSKPLLRFDKLTEKFLFAEASDFSCDSNDESGNSSADSETEKI